MSGPGISRRAALRKIFSFTAGGAAVVAGLGACGKSGSKPQFANACADEDSLSVAEESMRKSAHYVEQSPDAAKTCKVCAFFAPAGAGGPCGNCQIFNGPVNAEGYCDSWAGKS